MRLKVLSSSSTGNCYLLQGDNESLVIEAGKKIFEVQKALNFDLSTVTGCLISHYHGDHSAYIKDFLNAGINCYLTNGTKEALDIDHHRIKEIKTHVLYKIGNFSVYAFETKHDCDGSVGFIINHKEMGNLLFATDTYYIEYLFRDLNHILIEANYSKSILEENINKECISNTLARRIQKSHFEIENVKAFLKANDISSVKNIVLIHLSDNNSNAKQFKEEIEAQTFITTYIAQEGLEIKL